MKLFHFWVQGNEGEAIDVTEILHIQDFGICVQKYIQQTYIHSCDAVNGSEKKMQLKSNQFEGCSFFLPSLFLKADRFRFSLLTTGAKILYFPSENSTSAMFFLGIGTLRIHLLGVKDS